MNTKQKLEKLKRESYLLACEYEKIHREHLPWFLANNRNIIKKMEAIEERAWEIEKEMNKIKTNRDIIKKSRNDKKTGDE